MHHLPSIKKNLVPVALYCVNMVLNFCLSLINTYFLSMGFLLVKYMVLEACSAYL